MMLRALIPADGRVEDSMLNQVNLIGNLGADPETRDVGDSSVCKFSLATSETYKDRGGERQTRTEWHSIVVWGNLAEICQKYLQKGSRVYIGGKIQTRMWEAEGKKNYRTEIVGHQMKMLDAKKEGGGRGGAEPHYGHTPDFDANEEIPF
jgi:single-strand DNA-binding protein